MAFDERLLNGMSAFSAVVRNGSFARAGEALNMSQPGVSRAIARLEGRLGIRLFNRTTRSVALTDEGRRLYEQIVPLLGGLEEAATSVTAGKAIVSGRLRVNIHHFFSQLIVGPRLATFLEKFPELELELLTRDQLGDIVAEGFDLAIRFGQPRPSRLIALKLLDTRVLTVAAPSYIERHGRPKSPRDLERGDHVLIEFRDPEAGRPFAWEFHRRSQRVMITTGARLLVNDVGTEHAVCLAGYGIAQLLQLGIERVLAQGRLIDLFPDWPDERFPLFALYPSRKHLPPKTKAFIDFVARIARPGADQPTRRR
jgi:DNA-binding transcriptional LysR family regulator